ncbi:MAG TPA: hypothetical protein VH541_06775 [Gaiellaceae bacterium]|jgi:hypothetical protein
MPQFIDGREIVVQAPKDNWSFHLPRGHSLELTEHRRFVILSAGVCSSLFELKGTSEEQPGELLVMLGDRKGNVGPGGVGGYVPEPTGYPLPTFDEERKRLESRCAEAGGEWTRISSWAAGDTWESCMRRVRAEIRAMEEVAVSVR